MYFFWKCEAQEAVETLKANTPPVFSNMGKPLLFYIDASEHEIGPVLVQTQIGSERTIYYVSRSLNNTQNP